MVGKAYVNIFKPRIHQPAVGGSLLMLAF